MGNLVRRNVNKPTEGLINPLRNTRLGAFPIYLSANSHRFVNPSDIRITLGTLSHDQRNDRSHNDRPESCETIYLTLFSAVN